jgi:DNA-binding MarR family transcriptional regulator
MNRPARSHSSLAASDGNDLGLALYVAVRAVSGRYRPLLGELGLTFPQYLVMMCLWKSGELTVGELGQRLGMDTGTLSPMLTRLEAAGVVGRRPGATDRRTVFIGLTPAGRGLRERARGVSACMIEALGLDAAQFQQLRTRLRQLADLDPRSDHDVGVVAESADG